jgi:hypothetical protein
MDQPFESDVMEDLAAEGSMSSSSEYHAMEEEGFDAFDDNAFSDGMDEFAAEDVASFEEDVFGDNLEEDLWDDYAESADEFNPHRTNQRESNRTRHDQGQRRQAINYVGERGDERHRGPRHHPPEHRGPRSPRDNFEFFSDEETEFETEFENSFGDSFSSDGEFTESNSVDAIDAMEISIADALEAEDSDEFLRRIVSGVRRAANVARQVGQRAGQAARAVAPVASAIPLPQAQALGRVASIAGRLLAEGADEFEVLDELLTFAEDEDAIDAAAPIIAGLTIRTIMPRTSRLDRTTRRQLMRSVRQSTQTLARRQGPQAIRAIPRVVQAVRRTARRRQMPARHLPQAVRRTTARVASHPRLVSQLAHATRQASSVTRSYRTGMQSEILERLVIRGPVEIMIRSR